jgi:HSP20 family protein
MGETLMLRLADIYQLQSTWLPPTDIFDMGSHIFIRMEISGINTKDVSIHIQDDLVLIKGYRNEAESTKMRVMQMEIIYGQFERRFRLPCIIDSNSSRASYNNGFLEIYLPKAENPVPRPASVVIVMR